jgi:hypothetical protein
VWFKADPEFKQAAKNTMRAALAQTILIFFQKDVPKQKYVRYPEKRTASLLC